MILLCYLDYQTDFVSMVRPLLGVEGIKSSTRTLTCGAPQAHNYTSPLRLTLACPGWGARGGGLSVVDIDRWMVNHKLTLDEDKTEQWLLPFKKELKLLNTIPL